MANLTVLANLDDDAAMDPGGGVIADAAGDLFGATSLGGASNDGVVYELAKTSAGYASTPTVLASFDGADGQTPSGSLVADAAGDLFGTTSAGGAFGFGTVFEIAKTSTGYASTPTLLASFDDNADFGRGSGLVINSAGDLFGSGSTGLFEIAKTSIGYSAAPTIIGETVGSLTIDAAGDLFGVEIEGGSVRPYSPPYYSVTELARTGSGYAPPASLYVDSDDIFSVTTDAAGDLLYGVSSEVSNVLLYELPKTSTGYASTPTLLTSTSLNEPPGNLTVDSAGDLFVTAYDDVYGFYKTTTGYAPTPAAYVRGEDVGPVLVNAAGNLFGATEDGGSIGTAAMTVFELSDLQAPVLAITSAGGLTNQTTQTIAGTMDIADAGPTVSIYDGTTLLGTVTPTADGDWSATVTLLPTQGAQSITAQATNAGEVGTSPAVIYTLDTVPPTLSIASTSELPNSNAQILTGSIDAADAGLTISIYDGSTLVGTTTANGLDLWAATVALPSTGFAILTAQATDLAGNLGVSNEVDLATGGGQALGLTSAADTASLYDTGGDFDIVGGAAGTVYLSSAQVESFNTGGTVDFEGGSGNAAAIYGTGASWDYLDGGDGLVVLTQANVEVTGGGDAVYFEGSGENAAAVYNTGGVFDAIAGSNGEVVLTAAFAEVTGGGDAVYFEGTSANIAALYNTGGVFDGVTGSNGEVVLTNAQAEVVGGGNSIYLEGAAANTAALYNTGTNADAVTGSNGLLVMTNTQATVTGSSDTIYLVGANTVTQNGASDAFVFQPTIGEDTINGFAATDTMQFSAADFANFAALQSHTSQSGANTVITLDASNTVTLTDVTATSLTQSQFHFV